jgi:lipopolysaccharide/colanic/teichoic acid biosynthesis glycosyltransferase
MQDAMTSYHRWGKRLFDIVVSATVLMALAPLLLLIAILVRLRLGTPVLFRQTRSGVGKESFTILKFRSMTDQCGPDGQLLSDSLRLTPLGRFLRATSLDELPELVNVLRGDMSLVGPRPLLKRYDAWYLPQEERRFAVRPGITGWAQVNGRNALSWEERFALDTWYVDACSFWLDLRILVWTVVTVLRRENVHVNTDLTVRSLDEERRTLTAVDVDYQQPTMAPMESMVKCQRS